MGDTQRTHHWLFGICVAQHITMKLPSSTAVAIVPISSYLIFIIHWWAHGRRPWSNSIVLPLQSSGYSDSPFQVLVTIKQESLSDGQSAFGHHPKGESPLMVPLSHSPDSTVINPFPWQRDLNTLNSQRPLGFKLQDRMVACQSCTLYRYRCFKEPA